MYPKVLHVADNNIQQQLTTPVTTATDDDNKNFQGRQEQLLQFDHSW